MSRGRLHVEMLPRAFPGDRPEGAAAFVKRVRAGLNVRFQGTRPPRVLFTDRGAGFFNPGSGRVTSEYKTALAVDGLRAFMRDDAKVQPGKLGDLMLHETAVSWIRERERKTLPKRPWEETPEQFATRLKGVVADIDAECDVEGLCRKLPGRVQELYEKKGRKLKT